MDLLAELTALVLRNAREGSQECMLPGVSLHRWSATFEPMPVVYGPQMCVVVQGRKVTMLGQRSYEYGAGDYLVAAFDLPVTGAVSQATVDEPCMAISLVIDPKVLSAVMLEMPSETFSSRSQMGMAVDRLNPELLDSLTRLMRLLDRPTEIRMLAPMLMREILFRLLLGPQEALLRQILVTDGAISQISKAIAMIRSEYMKPLRISEMARTAGMSQASLFRHFKAVTGTSPLQFQKSIRLQEARQLLLAQQTDISGAGFAVGYENPSQFIREYGRLFGEPPLRDIKRLRSEK